MPSETISHLAYLARDHTLVVSGLSLVLMVVRRKTWPLLTRDRRFLLLFLVMTSVTWVYGIVEQIFLGIPAGTRFFLGAMSQTWLLGYLWTSFPREFRYTFLHPKRRKRHK